MDQRQVRRAKCTTHTATNVVSHNDSVATAAVLPVDAMQKARGALAGLKIKRPGQLAPPTPTPIPVGLTVTVNLLASRKHRLTAVMWAEQGAERRR